MESANQLIDFINNLSSAYDRIRLFEAQGCTKEQLEKELQYIRDIAGNFPSILSVMLKESPASFPLVKTFISTLKPIFTNALNMQLVLLSMVNPDDKTALKTQVVLSLGNINNDNYIDGLKACKEFLRTR